MPNNLKEREMGMMINGNEDHIVGMSMSMRTCIKQKLCIKMHVMLFHLLLTHTHTSPLGQSTLNPQMTYPLFLHLSFLLYS